ARERDDSEQRKEPQPMTLSLEPAGLLAVGLLLLGASSARTEPPAVSTRAAEAVGLTAVTVNGSIHPHGTPTRYWFEYGSTPQCNSKTSAIPLPPRRAAFYHEGWDENFGGW